MKSPLRILAPVLALVLLALAGTAVAATGVGLAYAVALHRSDLPRYTLAKSAGFPNSRVGLDPVAGGMASAQVFRQKGRLGAYTAVFISNRRHETIQEYVAVFRGSGGARWFYRGILKQGLSGHRVKAGPLGNQWAVFRFAPGPPSSQLTTAVFRRGRFVAELDIIKRRAPTAVQVERLARVIALRMGMNAA